MTVQSPSEGVRRIRRLRALRASRTDARPVPDPPDLRELFSRAVIDRLDGPILRYSRRIELVEIAGRLGIERFEANLIIAQVQYGAGRTLRSRDVGQLPPATSRRLATAIPYAAAGCLQAAIVVMGWLVLR